MNTFMAKKIELEIVENTIRVLTKRSEEIKAIIYATPENDLNKLHSETTKCIRDVDNNLDDARFISFMRMAIKKQRTLHALLRKQKKYGAELTLELSGIDSDLDHLNNTLTKLLFPAIPAVSKKIEN